MVKDFLGIVQGEVSGFPHDQDSDTNNGFVMPIFDFGRRIIFSPHPVEVHCPPVRLQVGHDELYQGPSTFVIAELPPDLILVGRERGRVPVGQRIAHGEANQNGAPGILIEQFMKEPVRPVYDVNHQAFHLFIT